MATLIVCAPYDDVIALDEDALREAAGRHWPGMVTFETDDDPHMPPVTVHVRPPGQRPFQVFLFRGGDAVGTDGDEAQMANVAAWVRSLLPADPAGQIWLADPALTGHYELPFGVRPEEIPGTWVEHRGS